jgi:hypothetical protein
VTIEPHFVPIKKSSLTRPRPGDGVFSSIALGWTKGGDRFATPPKAAGGSWGRQAGGCRNELLIAGVEGGTEEEDGGDAPDDLGEILGLFGMERTAEKRELAVA